MHIRKYSRKCKTMELFFLCIQVTKAVKYAMPSRCSQNLCNIGGVTLLWKDLWQYMSDTLNTFIPRIEHQKDFSVCSPPTDTHVWASCFLKNIFQSIFHHFSSSFYVESLLDVGISPFYQDSPYPVPSRMESKSWHELGDPSPKVHNLCFQRLRRSEDLINFSFTVLCQWETLCGSLGPTNCLEDFCSSL